MARGPAPPPSSLTSDDLMALAHVRKDMWVNAAKGFALGGSSTYLLHRATKFAHDKRWIASSLGKNTAFASVMVGCSLGSFLFATTTGKNAVHTLHPVFQRGARPMAVLADDDDGDKSVSYQTARQRQTELRELENRSITRSISLARQRTNAREQLGDEGADRLERERNRVMRRASLTRNLKAGHGLSDSHGGNWVQDDFKKE